MKVIILVVVLLGVAAAALVKRQVPAARPVSTYTPPSTYTLPSGAELIVGDIRSTFSCIDKIYGYYADVDNNCQIFHVCVPFVDEYNNQYPLVYNFFCGNQTVFDQETLICAHPDNATPCSEALSYYRVNENFGKTDRPIVRE